MSKLSTNVFGSGTTEEIGTPTQVPLDSVANLSEYLKNKGKFVMVKTDNILHLNNNKLFCGEKELLAYQTKPPDSDGNGAEYELGTERGVSIPITLIEGAN